MGAHLLQLTRFGPDLNPLKHFSVILRTFPNQFCQYQAHLKRGSIVQMRKKTLPSECEGAKNPTWHNSANTQRIIPEKDLAFLV